VDIENLIEVVVNKVTFNISESPVVVLLEKGGSRTLSIWIGSAEAASIAIALKGEKTSRPVAHDLFCQLAEALDARIIMVVVNNLSDNVFYARIILAQGENKILSLDSRPSDAIAIALRSGARIYVTREVMDKSGLNKIDPQ